jgi:anaerobic selenocysteine-containing dehydrogenase
MQSLTGRFNSLLFIILHIKFFQLPRQCVAAPGGEARPAWEVVAEIIAALGGERITEPLRGEWEQLRELDAEGPGVNICHGDTEAQRNPESNSERKT